MLLVGYGALPLVHFDPHYYSENWSCSLDRFTLLSATMLFDSKASTRKELQFSDLH